MTTIISSASSHSALNLSSPSEVEVLGRKQSRLFPLSYAQFEQAQACFKKASDEKTITASQILVWHVIQGAAPNVGFTAITNANKLLNGATPWQAYEAAFWFAKNCREEALAPWSDMLIKEGANLKAWRWEGDHPLLNALRGMVRG